MAGDFVRMRTGLLLSVKTFRIAEATNLTREEVVANLYAVAEWFSIHGKYGWVKTPPSTIDSLLGSQGFAKSLMDLGWMQSHKGRLRLSHFTDVSSVRKSLGKKLRQAILNNAACQACGTVELLQIDHIIPVCRGGTSDPSNLQTLCEGCNKAKSRMTMEEFMRLRRATSATG